MKIQITLEQLRKVVDAVGDDSDFPKITDDPYVNYLVDCLVDGEFARYAEYDEAAYRKEIGAEISEHPAQVRR